MDFEDVPVWFWVLTLGVVGVAVGAFFGVFDFLFAFFYANPLIIVSVVGVIIFVLALYSSRPELALASLGLVFVTIAMDIYLPPYSVTCLSESGVGLNFIKDFPQSSFSDDTAFCKLWIDAVGWNPVLFKFEFDKPVPIVYYSFPFLMFASLFFAVLAFYYYPKFWASSVFAFVFGLLLLFLFDGQLMREFVLTPAGLFGYGLVPLLLFGLGSLFLIPDED